MRYEREKMAADGSAGRQRMRKQRKNRRIMAVFWLLTWFFVALNLYLFMRLQSRAEELNEQLDKVAVFLQLLQEETESKKQIVDVMSEEHGMESPKRGIMEESYASLCGLDEVERPRERSRAEIMQRLKQLGADSSVIREIYENSSSYPDKMLEALANNPEMADFVSGYTGNTTKASGGLSEAEEEADFPLLLQWDPRWGYVQYGDGSCIGLAGCGPTCLSMVLFYLTGDEKLTPDKIAAYSMQNGYYMSGTGTAWSLLSEVPGMYGVEVEQPEVSEWRLQNALDDGKLIICSMGAGDFTVAGHFVVIYGYDETGFFVNDPNCVARSEKRWTYGELESQIKHVWTFE